MRLWKKREKCSYDRAQLRPVLRSSICTGEQVAGFKHISTGKFSEVMLIGNCSDFQAFLEQYGISEEEVTTEY